MVGTNIKYLQDNDIKIWDKWVDKDKNLGRVYRAQWMETKGLNGRKIDQSAYFIHQIKNVEFSRRHIVCEWILKSFLRLYYLHVTRFFNFTFLEIVD